MQKSVSFLTSEPCPNIGGCANTSCPPGLVRHNCVPCPMSCGHVSSGTACVPPTGPCSPGDSQKKTHHKIKLSCHFPTIFVSLSSGCWCPEGQVMSHTQQCVLPEECVCEMAGVRYWPGQQMKVDCEICVCERGRPQSCKPNPDCSG